MPKMVLGLKMQPVTTKKEKPAPAYVYVLSACHRSWILSFCSSCHCLASMYQCLQSKKKLRSSLFERLFRSTTRRKSDSRRRPCSSVQRPRLRALMDDQTYVVVSFER